MAKPTINLVEELTKVGIATAAAISAGDVKMIKRQQRLIALLVKTSNGLKSSFDKNVKTVREINLSMGEEDLLATIELFRKESETGNKPGRKAKVKPTDAEMFAMILAGDDSELDEDEEELE